MVWGGGGHHDQVHVIGSPAGGLESAAGSHLRAEGLHHIRPAYQHLMANYQEGDRIWVQYKAKAAFRERLDAAGWERLLFPSRF